MINNVIGNRQLRQAVKAHFQRNDMFAMYYTLHHGAAVGTSTVNIPCAYGIGPTLQSSTISGGVISPNAATAQWTAKNGYWSGDQTSRVLLGNYTTELDWDTKLAVRDGAVLVCCQIEKIANPASANYIWSIGYNGTAGYQSHFQLRYSPGNLMQIYAKNDAQVEVLNFTFDFDTITPTIVNHFALLDNRASGKQLMSWWGDITGTRILTPSGTPTTVDSSSFFSCRPIVSGGEADPLRLKFAVGAIYTARNTESASNYALNAVRRIRVFNFKQNLPSNLTEIMQGLNQHNLLDCPELLTI